MDVCQNIFLAVLNMSMTGGIVIVLIMAARLFLQRVPRKFSYVLWGVALLRLLCPFSVSSVFSVFQVINVPVTEEGRMEYVPQSRVWTGISNGEDLENGTNYVSVPGEAAVSFPGTKEEPGQGGWNIGMAASIAWLSGITVMWLYSIWSMLRIKRQLTGAVRKKENIYLCDYIDTAFVQGVIRPRIYLPTKLAGTEQEYILLHEQTHIRRADHIFRLLAFLALSIHWFNPLVWCAFRLSERDMEMSCDEAVMEKMGVDLRAAYSTSLLNIASGRQVFGGTPLGFGEGNVKCRIKNIMRYQKAAAWIGIPVFIVIVILFVVLGSNPAGRTLHEWNQGGTKMKGSQQSGDTGRGEGTSPNGGGDGGIGGQLTDGDIGEDSSSGAVQIPVTRPVITDETMYGADPPELDYADGKIVIFHGSFGLFVYDMAESGFVGAVDLKAIGCGATQGDAYCDVRASKDGQFVYLHPLNMEEMYVYDVFSCALSIAKYDLGGVELFDGLEVTRECINSEYITGASSGLCVWDDGKDSYIYLECRGSGLVKDLYLVFRGKDTEKGFIKLFYSYEEQEASPSIFGYRGYTGYLDECADWDGYEQFLGQDYDGDGLIDRVYREEEADNESSRYRMEFGNGDTVQTGWMGGGTPVVETCDLNGDGSKEILFQLSYGDGSDPKAFGEAVLYGKQNGSYAQISLPKELCPVPGEGSIEGAEGLGAYTPGIVLRYERIGDGVQIRLQGTKDVGIDRIVPLDEALVGEFEQEGAEKMRCSVSYETLIVREGGKEYLEYHFEVFRKWNSDEIVTKVEYKDGGLQVIGWKYCDWAERY